MQDIVQLLSSEFGLTAVHTKHIISLIDDGNTIPFIARYRKEQTGSIDDQVLRALADRLAYLRNLDVRRGEITAAIEVQGKLTESLSEKIAAAQTLQVLEDLYRPYRPKRRTRGSIARERGLEPLAAFLLEQRCDHATLENTAAQYIAPEQGLTTTEEALAGAMDIIAESVSDDADIRQELRDAILRTGSLVSRQAREEDSVYRLYYDYSEPLRKAAGYRVLAINRGEKEGYLKCSVAADDEALVTRIWNRLRKPGVSAADDYIRAAAADGYKRLLFPSLENEIRGELTQAAATAAIKLFQENLSHLLLQPPLRGKTVLGFDPGYRTGCKLAVVDPIGRVLSTGVVYCTLPNHDQAKAEKQMLSIIEAHNVDVVAIGNGTATKESEIFVAGLIPKAKRSVQYAIVNESGASVYSASPLGAAEFPEYDVALRSAVSIARRIQDPLAELVKIDPKSIGVGQYQHDMNQKQLGAALDAVVEDCVNHVGADLNTASVSLLGYVSGISRTLAQNIVAYREENGPFRNRKELKNVAKLGDKTFTQCAGFLRIPDSDDPLDATPVHPESYRAAHALIETAGLPFAALKENDPTLRAQIRKLDLRSLSGELGIGYPTLCDIADAICRPGRDPRDELEKPILRVELLSMENLREGMVLPGTVRNVIDFGAFIDIGVHQDGLVHISEISNRFIRHPTDALHVGDHVNVKIIGLDLSRKRISLSMKQANDQV